MFLPSSAVRDAMSRIVDNPTEWSETDPPSLKRDRFSLECARICQRIAVIPPGGSFIVPATGYIRIERISIVEDYPNLSGRRVTVMSHVTSPTQDGRTVEIDVALSSFVIGRDYDQSADIVFAPVDKGTIDVKGPEVSIQVTYLELCQAE
jgi:hypothetical protein